MSHHFCSLASFKAILPFIDWRINHRSGDPLELANDCRSINYIADCYVVLPLTDRTEASKLLRKYLPKDWCGWPQVVAAATKRRDAFGNAIILGVLSDNAQADNYAGHYFYDYSENGSDFFRHRRSFKLLQSPCSKAEIEKFRESRKAGFIWLK